MKRQLLKNHGWMWDKLILSHFSHLWMGKALVSRTQKLTFCYVLIQPKHWSIFRWWCIIWQMILIRLDGVSTETPTMLSTFAYGWKYQKLGRISDFQQYQSNDNLLSHFAPILRRGVDLTFQHWCYSMKSRITRKQKTEINTLEFTGYFAKYNGGLVFFNC